MKRILLTVSVMFVLGIALTACGSSKPKSAASSSSTSTTSANGQGDFQAAFKAYQTCMSDHGVTVTDNFGGGQRSNGAPPAGAPSNGATNGSMPQRPGTTLPAGVTQAQYDAARTAYQDKLPQRNGNGNGNGPGGGTNGDSTRFTAYISCLKDHGVNVSTDTGAQALANIDRTTDAFKAAQSACQALEPQRPTNSGSTPTTAPSTSTAS